MDDSQSFAWVLTAALVYIFGTVGVTAFGNVPMNNRLDIIELSKLSLDQLQATRCSYELRWNQYHLIRTAFSVVSFSLLLWAAKNHFLNTNFINH